MVYLVDVGVHLASGSGAYKFIKTLLHEYQYDRELYIFNTTAESGQYEKDGTLLKSTQELNDFLTNMRDRTLLMMDWEGTQRELTRIWTNICQNAQRFNLVVFVFAHQLATVPPLVLDAIQLHYIMPSSSICEKDVEVLSRGNRKIANLLNGVLVVDRENGEYGYIDPSNVDCITEGVL